MFAVTMLLVERFRTPIAASDIPGTAHPHSRVPQTMWRVDRTLHLCWEDRRWAYIRALLRVHQDLRMPRVDRFQSGSEGGHLREDHLVKRRTVRWPPEFPSCPYGFRNLGRRVQMAYALPPFV